MKPAKNIEKLIKNIDIDTNAKMDKAVLDNVLKAFEHTKKEKSAKLEPNIWKIIMKSRITKLAAAAVIIVAIGLFIAYQDSRKIEPAQVVSVSKSPAEMLTAASLNTAYRRGGIEAVERQCDEAMEKLGPRQRKITVRELLTEFNGT